MSGEQRAYHDLMDELADEAKRRRKAEGQAEALAKALGSVPCAGPNDVWRPYFIADCASDVPDCRACRALSAYRSGK